METKDKGQSLNDQQRNEVMEEKLRKEELESKIRKRVALEEKSHRIVERLIDKSVSRDLFCSAGKFITPSHYEDIVEERAIDNSCGYPVCDNTLPKILKQKYKISTKTNRVYDIRERKNFCSDKCYKASRYYAKQIPANPVWLRETQKMPDLVLLGGEKKNDEIAGEVVLGSELKSEIDELVEMDSLGNIRHGQDYSQNIEKISKGVDHITLEDFSRRDDVEEAMEKYQVFEKRFDKEEGLDEKRTRGGEKNDIKGKANSGNHCDVLEERIRLKKEMLAHAPSPEIITVGLDGKKTFLATETSKESVLKEVSSQPLVKEFQIVENVQNDQSVEGTKQPSCDIKQINAKANLLMQVLDKRDNLMSEMNKSKKSDKKDEKGLKDAFDGQACDEVCNTATDSVKEMDEKHNDVESNVNPRCREITYAQLMVLSLEEYISSGEWERYQQSTLKHNDGQKHMNPYEELEMYKKRVIDEQNKTEEQKRIEADNIRQGLIDMRNFAKKQNEKKQRLEKQTEEYNSRQEQTEEKGGTEKQKEGQNNTQKQTEEKNSPGKQTEEYNSRQEQRGSTEKQTEEEKSTHKPTEKQHNTSATIVEKKTSKVQVQRPFEFIVGILLEWRTAASIQYLTGEKNETTDGKVCTATATKKLPEEDSRSVMAKDTAEMSEKVFGYYGWKNDKNIIQTAKATVEKTSDERLREPNLPVVDKHSQISYRRKIVLDKLSKVLPNVLGQLRLPPRSITSELRELVHTFNLSSTNIVLKPAEWTLMSVVLIYILSVKIESIEDALLEESSKHFMTTIMQSIGLTENDIQKFVKNFLQKQWGMKGSMSD